jgi:hypothetical protein
MWKNAVILSVGVAVGLLPWLYTRSITTAISSIAENQYEINQDLDAENSRLSAQVVPGITPKPETSVQQKLKLRFLLDNMSGLSPDVKELILNLPYFDLLLLPKPDSPNKA